MSTTGGTPDCVVIYQDARTRFVELVRSLPAGTLARQLPTCPAWTVHQVVAHSVGANADFVSHNFPTAGMSFDDWTAAQVAKREGRSLDELIEEWDEMQPALTLHSEAGAWTAGEGEPAAAVTASAFELCRALAGRRSLSQIASFIWEGDPAPYVPLIPSFSAPKHDIVEQS